MLSHFKPYIKQKPTRLLSACLIMLCMSCQQQQIVDVDVPQVSKLYAAAFIGEGDSILKVYANRSLPVIGSDNNGSFTSLPDAEVIVNNSQQSVLLTYNPDFDYYLSSINSIGIKENETYTVTIKHNGDQSSGFCKLPTRANVSMDIAIDSTFDTSTQQYIYIAQSTVRMLSSGTHYIMVNTLIDFGFETLFELAEEQQQKVFKMQQHDVIVLRYKQQVSFFGVKPTAFIVNVYSTDEPFYLYHQKAGQFDFSTFFPFSEPSFIYSNMTSGIGIVAAYRLSKTLLAPVP